MFCMLKKKKKHIQLISQNINLNHKKQVILLMTSNREGWHYLATKKPPALLTGITSKHHGEFYCLSNLHSLATRKKRESHKVTL